MAGSIRNGFETDLLNHIFTNTDIADIGDAIGLRGSTVDGTLYVALYVVAPTDSTAGTECSYIGYARVGINRAGGNWTVTGNTVSNTNAITFGECTAGPETIVGFAICTDDVEDVDDQIVWGDGLSLVVSVGVIPEFQPEELDVIAD